MQRWHCVCRWPLRRSRRLEHTDRKLCRVCARSLRPQQRVVGLHRVRGGPLCIRHRRRIERCVPPVPGTWCGESCANKWRGMLFGMTNRAGWNGRDPNDNQHLWRLWDQVGIDSARLYGWWNASSPVSTGRWGPHTSPARTLDCCPPLTCFFSSTHRILYHGPRPNQTLTSRSDVLASVYVQARAGAGAAGEYGAHNATALIAIASWMGATQTVNLDIGNAPNTRDHVATNIRPHSQ